MILNLVRHVCPVATTHPIAACHPVPLEPLRDTRIVEKQVPPLRCAPVGMTPVSSGRTRLTHQLPHQPLGCEVHLFCCLADNHRSIFVQVEYNAAAVIPCHRVPCELKPVAACAHDDDVTAKFQNRLMAAVEPVCCAITSEQRCKGDPEFDQDALFDQRLPQGPTIPFVTRLTPTPCALTLRCYLSISPRTISIEPITATTSASRRPLHIVSSACSVAKEGLRM